MGLTCPHLPLQSMVVNRYMAAFRDDIIAWQRRLMAVADVVAMLSDMQRVWLYLTALFLESEEVRAELPAAAARFEHVDAELQTVLKVRCLLQVPVATMQLLLHMTCHCSLTIAIGSIKHSSSSVVPHHCH